ncbi:hypothetical protein FS749_001615 [Ceratobasidium sp. UAMH 11750]|nr:hypothetical protein FS749_001615 [Ceratobasidium sp. UAMH 11750]
MYPAKSDDKDIDPEDNGTTPSALLDCEDKEDEEELKDISIPEIVPGLPEAQEAECAYKVLIKLSYFAKKLCFSCRVKTEFKAACEKEDVEKPHVVQHDMIIRWNSTEKQLEDGDWTFPAIMATQQSLSLPYHQRLKKEDWRVMKALITVLKPLRSVTEILS